LFFKFIQFNHITLDFKHFLYKYNGFSPSIQPIPRFYFLRFYETKKDRRISAAISKKRFRFHF